MPPFIRHVAVVVVLLMAGASCGRTGTTSAVGTPQPTATPVAAGTPSPAADASDAPFPVTIAADNGDVTIDAVPRRIVSLSTVSTEVLFAIGAGDQVVAVDSQSNYPPDAPVADLSSYTPNIEAIAALRPDLVFTSFDPGVLVDGLTALGIPVVLHGSGLSLQHAYSQIEQTGAATGHTDEASELVRSVQTRIEDAVAAAPTFDQPPTLYHEISFDLWSATSSTFIGQIHALFGLDNIADAADNAGSGFLQLSAEYILAEDPDLIVLGDVLYGESAETVAARPGWADLRAVRGGGVIELDTDIASRWGPRVADLVESISTALRERFSQ